MNDNKNMAKRLSTSSNKNNRNSIPSTSTSKNFPQTISVETTDIPFVPHLKLKDNAQLLPKYSAGK